MTISQETARFQADVIAGLSRARKTLPCQYFYDARGSHLFDKICELPEYYPTRTEAAILRAHGREMADALGPGVRLVEYGSGSSLKTRLLLDCLDAPADYVPVDISGEHLAASAARIAADYPGLTVRPVCADYTRPFALPESDVPARRVAIYFPGSTIGNFHPQEALGFLNQMAAEAGHGGGLLIGVDLRKPAAILEPAYNDAQGVTAAFNQNILKRINDELEGGFDLDAFGHHAFWNDSAGRVEMHLMSLQPQTASIGDAHFDFEEDETIWTECSYKYTVEQFAQMASRAGWSLERVWTDGASLFSVQYYTR